MRQIVANSLGQSRSASVAEGPVMDASEISCQRKPDSRCDREVGAMGVGGGGGYAGAVLKLKGEIRSIAVRRAENKLRALRREWSLWPSSMTGLSWGRIACQTLDSCFDVCIIR